MIHDLKIQEEYLKNLLSGRKKFEIRYNDRDYQLGDILRFREYGASDVAEHLFEVTHMHSGLGLKEGFVVLSLTKLISDQ